RWETPAARGGDDGSADQGPGPVQRRRDHQRTALAGRDLPDLLRRRRREIRGLPGRGRRGPLSCIGGVGRFVGWVESAEPTRAPQWWVPPTPPTLHRPTDATRTHRLVLPVKGM